MVEIGGSNTIEQSLACTKQGGFMSLVGFLSESKKSDLVPALLFGGKTGELVVLFGRVIGWS